MWRNIIGNYHTGTLKKTGCSSCTHSKHNVENDTEKEKKKSMLKYHLKLSVLL